MRPTKKIRMVVVIAVIIATITLSLVVIPVNAGGVGGAPPIIGAAGVGGDGPNIGPVIKQIKGSLIEIGKKVMIVVKSLYFVF